MQRTHSTNMHWSSLGLAAALGVSALGLAAPAQAEVSGNIGVVSKYALRGLTNVPENDGAAVQGGLDYAHESGFYAGWWASSLGYNYHTDEGTTSGTGFENDLYLGYAGSSGSFTYDIGVMQYIYLDVDDSNLTEIPLKVGFGPVTLGMSYLANDGWWGNQGDIYWSLAYETELPKGFTFGATLGYYTYDDSDNGKMCGGEAGCGITTKNSAFRHLDLSLSHPIGKTGADMSVTYIIGGKDRGGVEQEDTMVLGVSYNFDL